MTGRDNNNNNNNNNSSSNNNNKQFIQKVNVSQLAGNSPNQHVIIQMPGVGGEWEGRGRGRGRETKKEGMGGKGKEEMHTIHS